MARMNLTQEFKRFMQIGGTPTGWSARANTIDDLIVGEVGVFDTQGNKLTEAAASKGLDFKIATRKKDGTILASSVLNGNNLKGASSKLYVPSRVQIDKFGFDGTTGSIEELNDNTYILHFRLIDTVNGSHDGYYFKNAEYKTDLSATQEEIANGLALSAYKNLKKETDPFFKVDVLMNQASETAMTNTGNLTFSKGSVMVGAATNGAAVAAPGGYLRIGTGVSAPVYKVVASDANSITLDRPYTESEVLADSAVNFVTAANAVGVDYGVTLTGLPTYFINTETGAIKFNPDVMTWELTAEGTGASTVNHVQSSYAGSGTIDDVANLEGLLGGNYGEIFRMGQPVIFPGQHDTDTLVAGGGYSFINISFKSVDSHGFSALGRRNQFSVTVPATTPGYALSASADDITDVLEKLLWGSVNGNLDLG